MRSHTKNLRFLASAAVVARCRRGIRADRLHDHCRLRALQALSRYQLSDPESLGTLVHLFRVADSLSVQNAIARVLIRADYKVLARADLVRTLCEPRRSKAAHGDDVIEALGRRLQQQQ